MERVGNVKRLCFPNTGGGNAHTSAVVATAAPAVAATSSGVSAPVCAPQKHTDAKNRTLRNASGNRHSRTGSCIQMHFRPRLRNAGEATKRRRRRTEPH